MYRKIQICCTGGGTFVELEGKSIGEGLKSITFHHESGEHPEVVLTFDLKRQIFDEDGKFAKRYKKISTTSNEEEEPQNETPLPAAIATHSRT